MNYEVFTIGGGRFLYNFFGAVASICQSTQFKGAVTTALLISTIWVLFVIAFKPNQWDTLKTWLATSIVIIAAMLTPTATVKVTDHINPVGSAGYTVANVPVGLAALAGITSFMGDQLTKLTEAAMVDVDAPKLRDHGMMFGVRLLANATRMEVKNEAFSESLSAYIRNCLFYDIMLGRKSLDSLKSAPDPFAYMTANASQARMFVVSPPNGGQATIKTCQDGVADLTGWWASQIPEAGRRLTLFSRPADVRDETGQPGTGGRLDDARLTVVMGHVQNDLTSFHKFLIGTSRNASDILKRQMTINAIINEPLNWNAEMGNAAAVQSYIDARLALQTRQSYKGIARQAEQWVPNLKAVFQGIYYGIFPLAFLLMLSPVGGTILRNYIFGFVWIESWGPLYAILNYFINISAQNKMQAVVNAANNAAGKGDIHLIAQAGIQAVEADISIQAGYLSMSVPFIAIALAAGAGRFAHLASSTLAVTQEAVGDTTRESATGNLSVGNTSHDTHAFHNYAGFNHNTSAAFDSGHERARTREGGMAFQAPDGQTGIHHNEGWSTLPTDINLASSLSSAQSQSAARARTAATGASKQYTSLEQKSEGWTASLADSITSQNTSSLTYATGENVTIGQDFKTLNEAAKTFGEEHKLNDEEALQAVLQASISGKLFGTGTEGRLHYQNNNTSGISFSDALRFSEQEQVSESLGRVMNASRTDNASWSEGTGQSFTDAQQAAYTEMETLAQSRDASYQKAQRYEEASSSTRQNSANVNQSLTQPFVNYVAEQDNGYGGKLGIAGATELLLSADPADIAYRDQLAQGFVQDWIADHPAYAPLTQPDLKGTYKDDAAGVNSQGGDIGSRATKAAAGIRAGSEGNAASVNTGQETTKSNAQHTLDKTDLRLDVGADLVTGKGQDVQSKTTEKTNTDVKDTSGEIVAETASGGLGVVIDMAKDLYRAGTSNDPKDTGGEQDWMRGYSDYGTKLAQGENPPQTDYGHYGAEGTQTENTNPADTVAGRTFARGKEIATTTGLAVAGMAAEQFHGPVSKAVSDGVKAVTDGAERVEEFADVVKERGQDFSETVEGRVEDMAGAFKEQAGELFESAKEGLGPTVETLKGLYDKANQNQDISEDDYPDSMKEWGGVKTPTAPARHGKPQTTPPDWEEQK